MASRPFLPPCPKTPRPLRLQNGPDKARHEPGRAEQALRAARPMSGSRVWSDTYGCIYFLLLYARNFVVTKYSEVNKARLAGFVHVNKTWR